jgi:hypothetical protein
MRNIQFSIEHCRFSENDILLLRSEHLSDPFQSLEPNQVYLPAFVAYRRNNPLVARHPDSLNPDQFGLKLDKGKIIPDLGNPVKLAPVNITKREKGKKFTESADIQLLFKQLSPDGANSFQEFNGGAEK